MNRLKSLAVLLLASGCGGPVSPELYNFVVDYFTAPASCYRSGMQPTTSTMLNPVAAGQFEVWDGPDGKAFLQFEGQGLAIDMGDAPNVTVPAVLEGAPGTGGWNFAAERTDKSMQGGNNAVTVTTRTRLGLVFPRGSTFKGTLSASSSRTCEGTACPADFATTNPSCSIASVAIRGSQVLVQYERAP